MTELKDSERIEYSERQPCEVWTRIGKKGEFSERKYFTEKHFNKHINFTEHVVEKKKDDYFK